MFAAEETKKVKTVKKITSVRLKNIALYYLKRFDTTKAALRQVLMKRVNEYAYYNPGYDKTEAIGWVENIISDFERYGYLDDKRFAENRCRDYIAAGKAKRYIIGKLKEKGVSEDIIEQCFAEQEYSAFDAALKLAKKKRIAGFRKDETERKEMRQKDMGVLVRAGFDYDTVAAVMDYRPEEDC